nr:MAG TPA: hypothetical protein [Caudoviricetes sp.]
MAADTAKTAAAPVQPAAAVFHKSDIIESEKYKQYADILQTELEEGKTYTDGEVQAVINGALSHVVKEEVNP